MQQTLFLTIGLIFSPLAALMAYAITYAEYVRHYPEKRTPMLLALRTACVTLGVFLVLSVVAGWAIRVIVAKTP